MQPNPPPNQPDQMIFVDKATSKLDTEHQATIATHVSQAINQPNISVTPPLSQVPTFDSPGVSTDPQPYHEKHPSNRFHGLNLLEELWYLITTKIGIKRPGDFAKIAHAGDALKLLLHRQHESKGGEYEILLKSKKAP